jgi:hypothetical protein
MPGLQECSRISAAVAAAFEEENRLLLRDKGNFLMLKLSFACMQVLQEVYLKQIEAFGRAMHSQETVKDKAQNLVDCEITTKYIYL